MSSFPFSARPWKLRKNTLVKRRDSDSHLKSQLLDFRKMLTVAKLAVKLWELGALACDLPLKIQSCSFKFPVKEGQSQLLTSCCYKGRSRLSQTKNDIEGRCLNTIIIIMSVKRIEGRCLKSIVEWMQVVVILCPVECPGWEWSRNCWRNIAKLRHLVQSWQNVWC